MSIGMILLVVLVILALGGMPYWGIHRYGYGPSGLFGTILVILVVLMLLGRVSI